MKQIETRQFLNRMLRISIHSLWVFTLSPLFLAGASAQEREFLTLDENVWATFYDLPSRRFRNIRDAFVRRDFDAAESDLQVAINFTSIEASRAPEKLQPPMSEAIAELESIRENIRDTSVSGSDLDSTFARVHWLLAQHYLMMATDSRDAAQHKNAGRYLWATAHHLERAVLWSDARIDRSVLNALESSREMGTALQTSDRPERVYRNRPVAATGKTLVKIGEQLNRPVWVRERLELNN